MSRKIPKLLQQFAWFIDGTPISSAAVRANLPGITLTTKEHKGGGMFTAVDVTVGAEKLTMGIGVVEYIPALFGLIGQNDIQMTFRGYARGSTGEEQSVVAYGTGVLNVMEGFEHAPGDGEYEIMLTASLTHYALELDGVNVLDIDTLNGKFIRNGENMLGRMNEILGL